jgi:hypothetical protein
MIGLKVKLWRHVGVAALLGVAACSGEGGEAGGKAGGEAGEAAVSGEAGEAAIGETGGEAGEAGVAAAYAGLEGTARTTLRLYQLKGFLLIAQRAAAAGDKAGAGALVGQGVLEVYDAARADFGGFDISPLRTAETAAADGKPDAEVAGAFDAALAALEAAIPADADHADIAARMADVAAGIYSGVIRDGFVDPIEYQHSQGTALAAREALAAGRTTLRRANAAAYDQAQREIERFVTLWPTVAAPETPTPPGQVLAQSSRIRLELAPLLTPAE